MKILKIIGTTLGVIVLCLLITITSYVLYVVFQYDRIDDDKVIDVNFNKTEYIKENQELTFTSYNIGFGAYSKDYTFFMDKGYDINGNLTHGYYGKGINKDDVLKNTNGSINVMKRLDSDFVAIQEVDIKAHRSYKINQGEMIDTTFKDKYASTFASNFHSAYLAYPFHDMHGATEAGLKTLSKYKIDEAMRKSYTVTTKFPDKYMDLDRCFSIMKTKAPNGKELVIINSHMSAYDEGGKIRAKQAEELNKYIDLEYNKGNFVIVGGDFNHDLLTFNPLYNYNLDNLAFSPKVKRPEWVCNMFTPDGKTHVSPNFKVLAADNLPSCRGCNEPYNENSYVTCVDGFLVSNNIDVIKIETHYDLDNTLFNFSDHMPTTLTFKLK